MNALGVGGMTPATFGTPNPNHVAHAFTPQVPVTPEKLLIQSPITSTPSAATGTDTTTQASIMQEQSIHSTTSRKLSSGPGSVGCRAVTGTVTGTSDGTQSTVSGADSEFGSATSSTATSGAAKAGTIAGTTGSSTAAAGIGSTAGGSTANTATAGIGSTAGGRTASTAAVGIGSTEGAQL